MYLPLMGPTTVRDLLGSTVDFLSDPMHWASYDDRAKASDTRLVVSGFDTYLTTEDQLKALLSDSVDPYATLRSVYLQSKQGEINGGNIPADLPDFDAPVAPAADGAASEDQSPDASQPPADHAAQLAAVGEP
jgi:phospholipid-binding lipoprotein MlaA